MILNHEYWVVNYLTIIIVTYAFVSFPFFNNWIYFLILFNVYTHNLCYPILKKRFGRVDLKVNESFNKKNHRDASIERRLNCWMRWMKSKM